MVDSACKNGLSSACFSEQPAFARRAFSFRLLSAFVPPALSRKLLTFLGLIRFDPAGNLPDWLDLPPWWIILPGTIIPPGWKFGDVPFDGLFIPPIFGPPPKPPPTPKEPPTDPPTTPPKPPSPFPPYLPPYPPITPWIPGPAHRPSNPPPIDPWFYDGFSSLDLSVWEKWLDGSATIALDGAGNVLFTSTGTDYCILRTAADPTIPDKWIWTFRLKVHSHSGSGPDLFCEVFSGSHNVRIRFNPPTTIWHATGAGADEITVPNYLGSFHIYTLYYDDGYTNLFQDGVLISSNQHHQHSLTAPGRISFSNDNEITCRLDYISIDPI